jgi:hypothetical protein
MLFWKRREIYMGSSLEEYAAVRQKLAANHIRYDIKSVNRFGSSAGRMLPMGRSTIDVMNQRSQYMDIYYVYVHNEDYDRAMEILHTQ